MRRTLARPLTLAALACWSFSAFAQTAAAPTSSPTLAAVKARGTLNCGVIGSSANFSLPDSQGVMRGIDADSCRAVAAAIFGDATKVKYVSLAPAQRLVAVQSGEVDVAYANITWTMTRETKSGVQFANVNFYDAWGFLVPKASGVSAAAPATCQAQMPSGSDSSEPRCDRPAKRKPPWP